jgi:hypothetical protein
VNGIRSTPGAKLWQRNYYEHIVRDGGSMRYIRDYIGSNASRWEYERIAGTQRRLPVSDQPEMSFDLLRVDANDKQTIGYRTFPR